MATVSSCADSRVPTSQSDTESVASPTAALKAQLRGLADRRARVEAGLLRITHRQQRRQLHGIFATKHGEDADPVDCSPEVEVASDKAQVFMFRDFITLFLVGVKN